MRSLNWLKASWELEDPQHRTWPTTEVTRDSRESCSSSIRWDPATLGEPGLRGTQLPVSAGPADFFLPQLRLHMILQSPQQKRPAASPLPHLGEGSYSFTFHASHVTPALFVLVTPFFKAKGLSAQRSQSLILIREGGEEAERRSVLVLLGRAACVQGSPPPSHRHAWLPLALFTGGSLAG